MQNLLDTIHPDALAARGFHWDHAPRWEALPGAGMRVFAPPQSDYFQDPAGVVRKDDAPYLWLLAKGDFVAQAHVRPNWLTTYDAAVLMVRRDEMHWAKLCFEKTDFGTTAAVSVVTNGVSDDANGVDLTQTDLWLQICRVGQTFGLQYALDGQSWRMVRLCHLEAAEEIKVGLVAQSPIGPGVAVEWLSFGIEARRVTNIRAGI
jgi:uncharacterized protein